MAEGFGELGGAGDIVERAIWACARMREASGPDTALADALCAALAVPDLDSLFEGIKRDGWRSAPSWRRSCSTGRARRRGAHRLLEEQGRSLADEVLGVARRLDMLDTAFELVIAGSVHLAGSAPLDSAFTARVAEDAPRAQILPLRERP